MKIETLYQSIELFRTYRYDIAMNGTYKVDSDLINAMRIVEKSIIELQKEKTELKETIRKRNLMIKQLRKDNEILRKRINVVLENGNIAIASLNLKAQSDCLMSIVDYLKVNA